MFPVQPPDGEIAFAGGMAHEMPEGDLVLRTLEALESRSRPAPQLLHDHVGQSLSAAGLQLDLLRMDLASALPVPQRIGEIQAMLDTVMGLVRDVNRELNPAVAERTGLRAALDLLAGRLRADFKGNVRVFADAAAQPPRSRGRPVSHRAGGGRPRGAARGLLRHRDTAKVVAEWTRAGDSG
jgi:hypothetical protein